MFFYDGSIVKADKRRRSLRTPLEAKLTKVPKKLAPLLNVDEVKAGGQGQGQAWREGSVHTLLSGIPTPAHQSALLLAPGTAARPGSTELAGRRRSASRPRLRPLTAGSEGDVELYVEMAEEMSKEEEYKARFILAQVRSIVRLRLGGCVPVPR